MLLSHTHTGGGGLCGLNIAAAREAVPVVEGTPDLLEAHHLLRVVFGLWRRRRHLGGDHGGGGGLRRRRGGRSWDGDGLSLHPAGARRRRPGERHGGLRRLDDRRRLRRRHAVRSLQAIHPARRPQLGSHAPQPGLRVARCVPDLAIRAEVVHLVHDRLLLEPHAGGTSPHVLLEPVLDLLLGCVDQAHVWCRCWCPKLSAAAANMPAPRRLGL